MHIRHQPFLTCCKLALPGGLGGVVVRLPGAATVARPRPERSRPCRRKLTMHDANQRFMAWRWAALIGVLGGAALLACDPKRGSDVPAAGPVSPSAVSGLMDESQRQYLWDIKHHGLVLSRQGFKTLAAALGREDARALTALLSSSLGIAGSSPRHRRCSSPS
jgi:hypothetical protein